MKNKGHLVCSLKHSRINKGGTPPPSLHLPGWSGFRENEGRKKGGVVSSKSELGVSLLSKVSNRYSKAQGPPKLCENEKENHVLEGDPLISFQRDKRESKIASSQS